VILLAAATLRLTGLAWDEFLHYHPDERFIAWVGTTIEWPEQGYAAAFDPHRSSFNPYYWPAETTTSGVLVPQAEPRRFAYGHFPLYLGVATTRLAEWLAPRLAPLLPADWLFTQTVLNQNNQIEFDHITVVGRVITALFDVGTVWLIYRLGQRLYGESVGLLAAAFLAVNVMHIQLAHFYTVDPFLTFFCVACLYFLLLNPPSPTGTGLNAPSEPSRLSPFYLSLAAAMAGLAVGAKFAAILLVLPLALRCWLDGSRPRYQRLLLLLMAGLIGFLAFFVTNPFAILDQTCEAITPAIHLGPINVPALNWGSCFLENVVRQGVMANGQSDLGFTRQYAGTTPYLYFLEMQVKWGMGPLLGAAALLGLLYFIYRLLKSIPLWHKQKTRWSDQAQAELILLAWVVPFLLSTGNFFVKFMRYLQPVTPILMLFAAALIWQVRPRALRYGIMTAVLLTATFYALAFSNMYQERHPWAAASEWIYNNIEPGATLTSEQWDDPLPTNLAAGDVRQFASQYQTQAELTWLTYADNLDTQARLQQNLALVAEADYLVISSHRVYAVVPRQPERFPLSSQFHRLLFDGQLGFEPVYVGTRMPNLAGIYFKWDTFAGSGLTPPTRVSQYLESLPGVNLGRADESFIVYDQPLPIIFANVQYLSPDELLAHFDLP
jgi:4-amino-4-deoxy-L-arabinose transferase-like glycosyltransferase